MQGSRFPGLFLMYCTPENLSYIVTTGVLTKRTCGGSDGWATIWKAWRSSSGPQFVNRLQPSAKPLAVQLRCTQAGARIQCTPCDLSVTTSPSFEPPRPQRLIRQPDRSSLACGVHPRHSPSYKLPCSKGATSTRRALVYSPHDVHDYQRRPRVGCRLGIEPHPPDVCWSIYPRRDRSVCDVDLSTPQELSEATTAAVRSQ